MGVPGIVTCQGNAREPAPLLIRVRLQREARDAVIKVQRETPPGGVADGRRRPIVGMEAVVNDVAEGLQLEGRENGGPVRAKGGLVEKNNDGTSTGVSDTSSRANRGLAKRGSVETVHVHRARGTAHNAGISARDRAVGTTINNSSPCQAVAAGEGRWRARVGRLTRRRGAMDDGHVDRPLGASSLAGTCTCVLENVSLVANGDLGWRRGGRRRRQRTGHHVA